MAQQVEHIKWIDGTNFMVDGFNFQNARCKNYFLTHFHSDHTTGLNRSFSSGVVYCSPITATLLIKDMGLPAERIIPLSVDTLHCIDGVTVTLMDANHCPGACMMLFEVPNKRSKRQVILHTGDMRWQPRLAEHPALKANMIDILYMDTTYCLPKHVFPSQNKAIATLIKVMQDARTEEPRTLFVVGSYHIGKERAFFGAARALGYKIWCHPAKKKVMEWCEMAKDDMDCLVSKEASAQIHVSFMGQGLQPEALEQRRLKGDYAKIVAFRPTGWSFQKKGLQTRREGNVTIYGIPYSEHSSFSELRDCVKRLRPKRIIPTVNCPDAASARAIVDRFADLMDLSKDKSRLDCYFGRTASAPASTVADAADGTSPPARITQEPHWTGSETAAELNTADSDCRDAAVPAWEDADGQCLDGAEAQFAPIKRELSCSSSVHWEAEQAEAVLHDAQCAHSKSPDAGCCREADDELLPMRAKLTPEHAHSAPAVLSPISKAQRRPEQHSTALASGALRVVGDTATEPDACTDLHDKCAMPGQQLQSDATDACDVSAQPTCSASATEQGRHHSSIVSQNGGPCVTASDTADEIPVPLHHSVCQLDAVDVAEQARILSQIQQQNLCARQYLSSKKRQATLGCFVAAKRVK